MAVGLAFLGDARRTGAFFTGFFLAVLAFLRVAALVTRGFLRVAWVLLLAFFLVAIYSLPNVTLWPWRSISLVKDFGDLDSIHVQTNARHFLTTRPIKLVRVQCW